VCPAILHINPIAQLAFVLLRIGFFCVALNSGGHPYPMGSFCRVLLFDWLRVGLLNLGLITGIILRMEIYIKM
jgi:hypothetical protein